MEPFFASTQRAEPAFDELGGTFLRRSDDRPDGSAEEVHHSKWKRAPGQRCAGVPRQRLLQQLRRRSRLVGGCLVHFNKANELPVSISLQRPRSLPGILFI